MHTARGINPGAELLGHQVYTFLALVNSALQVDSMVWYSHQQVMRVPGTPYPKTSHFLSFLLYFGVCFIGITL